MARFSRGAMPEQINHAGQTAAITVSFDLAHSDAVAGVGLWECIIA